jgi:hypothetical protein
MQYRKILVGMKLKSLMLLRKIFTKVGILLGFKDFCEVLIYKNTRGPKFGFAGSDLLFGRF